MSTLQQPLPPTHPPPQPSSQPPRKKLRANATPKLTLEQITQHHVIQSALRVGRRARANPPKPGQEHQALDNLLSRMQAWAHQVAPHYSLPEFVVAAQRIAGNRELRPMLAVFRLAELRHVTPDDPNPSNNHVHTPDEQPDTQNQPTTSDAAPVQADVAPDEAYVGPVGADAAPDDGDWDELDIVPDEAIEVRPLPNPQSRTPHTERDPQPEEPLNPDVEATIERNRLAALERRKAAIPRIATKNTHLNNNGENNPPLTKRSEQVDTDKATGNPHTPSPPAPETDGPSAESNVDNLPELILSNSDVEQPKRKMSHSGLASSEKENDLSQQQSSADKSRAMTLTKVLSENEEKKDSSQEPNTSEDKEEKGGKESALQQTDCPVQATETTDGPAQTEARRSQRDEGSCHTELTKRICNGKAALPNLNESAETTGASGTHGDENVDMEILAEFQEGGEV